jgi:hypothetical protein
MSTDRLTRKAVHGSTSGNDHQREPLVSAWREWGQLIIVVTVMTVVAVLQLAPWSSRF